MNAELAEKYQALKDNIAMLDSAVVAFSGGVDSSLVAYVAAQVLGNQALAITSGSQSLKRTDLDLDIHLGNDWNIKHRVIVTDELTKADYRANPVNRCFHCKTSLYDALRKIADAEGFAAILNGTNLDDLGDHRPGLIAADDHQVNSPLVDAGFHKADIRSLADELGLENAQKPQAACLSSRFPYGTAIDESQLLQVEAAESLLDDLGFTQYRVRHHKEVARLELLPEQFELAIAKRDTLNTELKKIGYQYIALDLAGFRSGSLNEGLTAADMIEVIQVR